MDGKPMTVTSNSYRRISSLYTASPRCSRGQAMPGQGYFQRIKCRFSQQRVGEKKAFLPFPLRAFNGIGAILIPLGLVEQFGETNILPPSFQFDHDGLVLIGVGFAFTLPALAHIITGMLHPSKTPPRPELDSSVGSTTETDESANLRSTPVDSTLVNHSSELKSRLKQLWANKKRRRLLRDFGVLGAFLCLFYPVAPTYPPLTN